MLRSQFLPHYMKSNGKRIAQLQASLRAMCGRVTGNFPKTSTRGSDTILTLFDSLKKGYDECQELGEACYYYTCM